jgi:hypothetical protein
MVETTTSDFDTKLSRDWDALAQTQDSSTKSFLEQNAFKRLPPSESGHDLGIFAIYNAKQDINRLILAEGTGDNVPKVEFGAGVSADDGKDPFEESLEDALCVFKSGAAKGETDILQENEAQLLFYVDLDNEVIVDKA